MACVFSPPDQIFKLGNQLCCLSAIIALVCLGSVLAYHENDLELQIGLPHSKGRRSSFMRKESESDRKQLSHNRARQLWQRTYNLRLCTGAPTTAPFVQGVYLTGATVARVTVFELEVVHMIKPGTTKWDLSTNPFVNVLAFFETHDSIHHTQWEDRALGVQSPLGEWTKLRCTFFAGKVKDSRAYLHGSDALLVTVTYQRYVNIHCPLPREDFTLQEDIQLELSLQDGKAGIFHIEPLPMCRDDGIPRRVYQSQPWSEDLPPIPPMVYPPISNGETLNVNRVVAIAERAQKTTVALCVRPYHDHHFFDTVKLAKSDERLLEYINYHLLIGVNRIYFYERYGTDKLSLLQPYVDRGLVIHIPFPVWSEVFYRKERFNRAKYPYNFPLIYDQVLVYEHCLMQGRRNYDSWMFFTDTDEFLHYPESATGGLPKILENLTTEYESKHYPQSLGAITIKRFNYGGANESGDPVLQACTNRCRGPIYNLVYHEDGRPHYIKYKDKLGSQPGQMLGTVVDVHEVAGPAKDRVVAVDPSVLRINHYSSTPFAEYKGELGSAVGSPCNKVEDPWHLEYTWVEDTSLQWVGERITQCTKSNACLDYKSGECGSLCPTLTT